MYVAKFAFVSLAMNVALIDGVAVATPPAVPQAESGPSIPRDEPAAIDAIVTTAKAIVSAAAQAGEKPVLRDAHAKGHGCVKATFWVRSGLDTILRQGVFARPHVYPAWIRFSNGNGAPQDDHANDGRGMAIKLIGVDGTKLLPDERNAKTQDFVMINYPVFFIRDAADYVPFTKLSLLGRSNEFFATHPREQAISKAIGAQTVDRVFEQRYFSMTPYRLGKRFIKFSARPVVCATRRPIAESTAPEPVGDPNFLRKDMDVWLGERDACFEFGVQLRNNATSMPIEDPTVLWDEATSPFVPVADIRIPRQQFDTPVQQFYCENLSFTPWHALPAHEPVGGINRVRRAVYQAISTMRHQLNGAVRREPTTMELPK